MLHWITLATLILSFPIRRIRPHLFKPYIKEAEELKNTATLAFSIVKHATDDERLHRLGRICYQITLWNARFPLYMESFGFPGATLFDYLNPWSDLRIALDKALPRMIKAMRQEIQMLRLVADIDPKLLGHGRRIYYSMPAMCWPESVQRRWSLERLTKVHSESLKRGDITSASATSDRNTEVD